MAQKPDYYEVLKLSTDAEGNPVDVKKLTIEQINAAHKKAVLQNHPDRKKTPEDKAAAQAKLQLVQEAITVLGDEAKRRAYDNGGHAALERLASTGSKTGNDPIITQPLEFKVKRQPISDDDVFNFFDKRAERAERDTGAARPISSTPAPSDDADAAEERRRNRLARRGGGGMEPTPTTPVKREPARTPPPTVVSEPARRPETPRVKADFNEIVETVRHTQIKVQENAGEIPLSVLEKFRENLAEFLGEIDDVIANVKKGPGGYKM